MEEKQKLWKSEKIELIHKNKNLRRKVGEMDDRAKDL